jgi:uncharacterized RDD family membrane protein YckC
MTENPPPPSGTPEGGGSTPPPPQNPYGSQPSTPPPPPQNPYGSQPPPPADPNAGNPPAAGQTPYGSTPPPEAAGQNPYGAASYPVTPGGPAPVAGTRPAGLGERLVARLIDAVIFFVVNLIVSLTTGSALITGIVGGILYLGYYTYMESNQGRTVGKQVMKMRVLGPTGGKPTMEEALKRNLWAGLSIFGGIPVLGIFTGLAELAAVIAIAVTISQDALNRGWHDKFGNTSVIKEG